MFWPSEHTVSNYSKTLDAYGHRCVEGRQGEGDEDIKENNFILDCPHFDLSKEKVGRAIKFSFSSLGIDCG